ncbi:uncharacterized protein CCR75_002117 [Bremia lactucae]|uniref:Uncharacterized protein n=1 Tax=Bremia lactucae TaxID=4779 RepID=A0A976FDF6_BRELC|nr:hypothetical protein CCR75_002117 [Bremia lactucae]
MRIAHKRKLAATYSMFGSVRRRKRAVTGSDDELDTGIVTQLRRHFQGCTSISEYRYAYKAMVEHTNWRILDR